MEDHGAICGTSDGIYFVAGITNLIKLLSGVTHIFGLQQKIGQVYNSGFAFALSGSPDINERKTHCDPQEHRTADQPANKCKVWNSLFYTHFTLYIEPRRACLAKPVEIRHGKMKTLI